MAGTGRREQILEKAADLFGEKGYHGTSVRDIAQEIGMLSGSLYSHIRSKEELLYEIVDGWYSEALGILGSIPRADLDATDKLRAFIRQMVSLNVEWMSRVRAAIFDWRALRPELQADIVRKRDAIERILTSILDEGVRTKEFRHVDKRFSRFLVFSAVNWVVTWYKPDGPLTPEQVADRFTDLMLDGFRHA